MEVVEVEIPGVTITIATPTVTPIPVATKSQGVVITTVAAVEIMEIRVEIRGVVTITVTPAVTPVPVAIKSQGAVITIAEVVEVMVEVETIVITIVAADVLPMLVVTAVATTMGVFTTVLEVEVIMGGEILKTMVDQVWETFWMVLLVSEVDLVATIMLLLLMPNNIEINCTFKQV